MIPRSAPEQSNLNARRRTRLFVLLGSLAAFSPLAIDMYLPAFPQIERELAAPPGSLQLTLSLFLAGLATGQFVIGPISDTFGRKRPLLLGCLGFAATAWLCGRATRVETLMAARFCMGFAGSAGLVVSRAIVRDLFDERESAGVYSFMMMVTGIAPVVAPLLGAELLAWSHWRSVFWVLALVGLMSAAASARILHETLPSAARQRFSLLATLTRSVTILGNRQFRRCALITGSAAGALFAYIGSAPTVFIDDLSLSPRVFSVIFASNAVGLFLAAQLNRRLLTRLGPHQLLRRAARISLIAGAMLTISATTGWGGVPFFAFSLFCCVANLGVVFPNAIALAMAPFPKEAGAASAVLGLLQYTLGAVAGSLVGWLHNGTPVPMAMIVWMCQVGIWAAIP